MRFGFRVRVSGLGLRVSGFRVSGFRALGSRVQGKRSVVTEPYGLGFRV